MSMKGLEPSWIAPLEPKPSAYTNSATSTYKAGAVSPFGSHAPFTFLTLILLCLGIEPNFYVCCPPVLTNRLPEEVGEVNPPVSRLATYSLTGNKKPGGSKPIRTTNF